jgi:two-component sensor histidine kinase/integral membrane sensor domain MASE1
MKQKYILKIFLFTSLYIFLAKAGLLLALDGEFASPVWLGSGTALCIFLLSGNNMWPAIAIGSFTVNLLSGSSLGFATVACIGNTLESFVAYHIIVYFKSQTYLFVKLKSVFVFLLAAVAGAITSAVFGGVAFYFFHTHEINFHSHEFNLLEILFTWWIGNFTSFLLIVPVVFLFNKSALTEFKNYSTFISIIFLILACYMTFVFNYENKVIPIIIQYALVLFPIVVSVTQNRSSTVVHLLIIDCFAVVATCFGKGPFVSDELNTNLIILQSFMAILTVVGLIISVAIKEKELIEDELKITLSEKEMLISEIHHRIKNNLAVVSGLLYLQNETIEDTEIKNKIDQTNLRIKTIALVHEKLYATHSVNTIEFASYIENLAKMIYGVYECNAKLNLNLEKIELPIEKAQPLGLILNELLTNAFKHAFTHTDNPEIEINFGKNENGFFLLFSDNGKGIENKENNSTLGLILIEALAAQIDAEYVLKNSNGTTYEFYFK